MVVNETVGSPFQFTGYYPSEIWLTVLYTGEEADSRKLVLPNEQAVSVNIRIYFRSSHDVYCNFTDSLVSAGQLQMISLEYNITASIKYTRLNSSESLVYNIYTLSNQEEYLPPERIIKLDDAIAMYSEISLVCAGFGIVAVFLCVQFRRIK